VFYSNTVLKRHRFWDTKNVVTWIPGQRSLKVVGTDVDRSTTYDSLLTFHSNHGPISHCFWDKRRFQSKIISHFPTPWICAHRWRGSPAHWVKKLEWRSCRAEQEVWRYLQPFGYNPPTWRRTRRTDTELQQRLRLRIASRGYKWCVYSTFTAPSLSLTFSFHVFTAILRVDMDPVPECLHSGLYYRATLCVSAVFAVFAVRPSVRPPVCHVGAYIHTAEDIVVKGQVSVRLYVHLSVTLVHISTRLKISSSFFLGPVVTSF